MYRNILLLLVSSLALESCSVGMALNGKKDPDLSVIKRGGHREDVELQLGSPVKIALSGEDTIAVYEYEIGNEPSPGRAAAHGAIDILTLGIWELVGTPIEAANGNKYKTTITYDKNSCIKSIRK